MDSERKSWERKDGEPFRWFSRFNRFRLMKAWKRSVNAAFEEENREKQGKTGKKIGNDWYRKAEEWQWDKRAEAWDSYRLEERDKQIAAEEAEVLREGYAMTHERVRALDSKARLIEKSWYDEKKGEVAFQWFTPDKIHEWRGCLDDIAKETGGRVKKQEITGKDGGPMEIMDGTKEILKRKLDAIKANKDIKIDKEPT